MIFFRFFFGWVGVFVVVVVVCIFFSWFFLRIRLQNCCATHVEMDFRLFKLSTLRLACFDWV